ncbi:MAG: polyphosphate kinase 2 family protein [Armatimonadetes bacterium]|nr:polyphosphate kinase 2 family protein [Armatimonadota bacterium]
MSLLAHRFDGSKPFRIDKIEPNDSRGLEKEDAESKLEPICEELSELADLLFYAGKHPLLIVLQGMDTSGKDGTIRFLLQHMNAQSIDIVSFKVPTPDELAHDFLWRCHQNTPGRGEITIFNRSHYEDVLVVRVHDLVPEAKWRSRYGKIVNFEDQLSDNETIIVKIFLHISKDEQEQRLIEREQETEKSWKLSVGDWKERQNWDAYQSAYEDAINETATKDSAWHVIPADKKWFRNLAVAEAIVEALRPYKSGWMDSLKAVGEKAKVELDAYRATLPNK